MGAKERRKGASGELSVARELEDLTGIKTQRILNQSRDGGSDLSGLLGFNLEVKTHKAFAVTSFLEQAKKAVKGKDIPLVLLNPDRKPTMVLCYLTDFAPLLVAYLHSQADPQTAPGV